VSQIASIIPNTTAAAALHAISPRLDYMPYQFPNTFLSVGEDEQLTSEWKAWVKLVQVR